VVDTWGHNGIDYGGHYFDIKLSAKVIPNGSTIVVESGNVTYGTNNDNSPEYYTVETSVTYGDAFWRRISFKTTTKDVYYTDEKGKKAGPVNAIVCTTGIPTTLGGDSTRTVYYYIDTIVSTYMRPEARCNAVLILGDNARVTTPQGISVEDDNTLTITTGGATADYEGTGSLTATVSTDGYAAAIGSGGDYDNSYAHSCGNIIINDGNVNATAYYYGAGIGSGKDAAKGGSITINGGNIAAYASPYNPAYYGYGAGIGGGSNRTNPDIVINGGVIRAYSSTSQQGWGAGIGAGNANAAGNITINGGTIVAAASESGDNYGAGIGGGYGEMSKSIAVGGVVKINGDSADVTATGLNAIVASTATTAGVNADAIVDYGSSSSDYNTYTAQVIDLYNMDNVSIKDSPYAHIYFSPCKIDVYYTQADGTVSDTTVKAYDCVTSLPQQLGDGTSTPVYYYFPSAIALDTNAVVNGNVVIILGDECASTISQGITVPGGSTLTITTGGITTVYDGAGMLTVTRTKRISAAVIGGLDMETCGDIIINDGTINATDDSYDALSSEYAAVIGSGFYGIGGSVTINGGTVYAAHTRNNAAGAAIGSGYHSLGNFTITINGGDVTAYASRYSKSSSKTWGAGIGTGEKAADSMTIVINGGNVLGVCSENGVNLGAGIGKGDNATAVTTIAINGNSAVVVAQGVNAMNADSITAIAIDGGTAVCEYGASSTEVTTVTGTTLDLLTNPT